MRRRYHIHLPGLLFMGVTALLGVGAINSQNNLLFLVFGLCLGAMIISGVLSGSMMMGLRLRRLAVADAVVGSPLHIGYLLRSTANTISAYAILIRERADPGDIAPSPLPGACVLKVGPGEQVHAYAAFVPTRRGKLRLDSVEASSSFPFGVFRKSVSISQPAEVLILPRVRPVRDELFRSLVSRRYSTSNALSNRRGIGEEFWGLREYVPGDSTRLIAWRSAARTGELVVRQHTETPVPRVRVIIVFAQHRPEQDHERLIEAAASVIAGAIDRKISCALSVPQAHLHTQFAAAASHKRTLLSLLAELQIDTLTTVPQSTRTPQVDAAHILLTDGLPPADSHAARVITLEDIDHQLFANPPEPLHNQSVPLEATA